MKREMQKLRDSNMELLRIFAMFLVLIYHADFLTIGAPSSQDALSHPLNVFMRLSIQSFANICVNVFILISGWYGIKPKIKRGCEFLFQLFFIMTIALLFNIIFLCHRFCLNDVKDLLLLNDVMWFPKSYFLLYVLSPVLNAYIASADEARFKCVLCLFFVFQCLYGWLCGGVGWFMGGYSTISFIGLYLLARYLRLYGMRIFNKYSFSSFMFINLLLALIASTAWFFLLVKGFESSSRWFNTYNSPIVIMQSILMLLAFNKLNFRNKFINGVASSCFAVYVFHCAPGILSYFIEIERKFYQYDIFIYLLYSILFLLFVFSFSVLLDKVRIIVWNKLSGLVSAVNRYTCLNV